jgi:hypothetical protein
VALVGNDVLEENIPSIIGVKRISELGTIAVTSNRSTLRRYSPSKRRFLQEPHGITSQKTAFFIVTTVKNSNLTCDFYLWGKLKTVVYGNNPRDVKDLKDSVCDALSNGNSNKFKRTQTRLTAEGRHIEHLWW